MLSGGVAGLRAIPGRAPASRMAWMQAEASEDDSTWKKIRSEWRGKQVEQFKRLGEHEMALPMPGDPRRQLREDLHAQRKVTNEAAIAEVQVGATYPSAFEGPELARESGEVRAHYGRRKARRAGRRKWTLPVLLPVLVERSDKGQTRRRQYNHGRCSLHPSASPWRGPGIVPDPPHRVGYWPVDDVQLLVPVVVTGPSGPSDS